MLLCRSDSDTVDADVNTLGEGIADVVSSLTGEDASIAFGNFGKV